MDYVEDIAPNYDDLEVIEEIMESLPDSYSLVMCNEAVAVFSDSVYGGKFSECSDEHMYYAESFNINKNSLFVVCDMNTEKIISKSVRIVYFLHNDVFVMYLGSNEKLRGYVYDKNMKLIYSYDCRYRHYEPMITHDEKLPDYAYTICFRGNAELHALLNTKDCTVSDSFSICYGPGVIFDKNINLLHISKDNNVSLLDSATLKRVCDWCDSIFQSDKDNNILYLKKGEKYSLIDKNGKIMCGWYEQIFVYPGNTYICKEHGEDGAKYCMASKYEDRRTEWYDYIAPHINSDDPNVFFVRRGREESLMSDDMELLCGWYKNIFEYRKGNHITAEKDGKLIEIDLSEK